MRYTFTAKKMEATEDLKLYAQKKIGKLEKLFRVEPDAYVTFSIERARHIAEVTIKSNGMFYRASEATGDMYASIDSAVASIERQIRKNKTRLEKRLREGAFDQVPDLPAEEEESESFDIIRTKRFAIKPMTTEEAILQMNLLGHEFFAFKNQDADNAFAIVYRRNNGGYGLIESDEE